MGDDLESQVEEEEVLLAIYDGDPAFKRISSTVFQYRVRNSTFHDHEVNSGLVSNLNILKCFSVWR